MDVVFQEDPRGCGIACAAMIAGVSYSEAKIAWETIGRDRGVEDTNGAGLTTKDIQDLLKVLGAPWNCVPLGCPLVVNVGGHFVVVGAEGTKAVVYDPVRR